MKKTTQEIMTVFWDGDTKVAAEYQNGNPGVIERYMLKPATKQDSATLLESETPQN